MQSNLKLSVQAATSQKIRATSEQFSFPQVALIYININYNAISFAFLEATAQLYMHSASEPPHWFLHFMAAVAHPKTSFSHAEY